MKKVNNTIQSLANSYVNAIGYVEKSKVNNLAKDVLNQNDWLKYIDKCILYERVELELLETELGLSGVQNEDNL